MRKFVVFYAWQSDTVQRLNRHLIRFALNLAAESISRDSAVGVRVHIDADTEGVLGHVGVTDTILKKIAVCNAFVPDLTFIAETQMGKLITNPNVMLEYGYALRAKSSSVMIPVMNTAYGPAKELPFDMGHLRFPLTYNLPETSKNADRRTVRLELTKEFEAILRLMIEAEPATGTPFQEARTTTSPAFYFRPGEPLAAFGHPGEQEYSFDGDAAIYLRLFPEASSGQPTIGRAKLKTFVDRRLLKPMSRTIGGLAASNDYGGIAIDPSGSSTTQGITQAFPTGELWGINSQVFRPASYRRFRAPDEAVTALGVISAEKIYTSALEHYASFITEELKLRPPFIIELGAVRLKGVYMGAPHPESSSGHYYGPFREARLVRRYTLRETKRAMLLDVLRQFLDELYDLSECSRSDVLKDEHVRINNIPPRT